MKKVVFGIVVGCMIISACDSQTGEVKLENGIDSLSYAYGISLGSFIKNEIQEDFNAEAFSRAIEELYAENPTVFSQEEANIFISSYQRKLRKMAFEKNLKEGRDFLAENKKRPEVKELPNGIQYEILKEGSGPKPEATDKVKTHYKGTLIDGTVFDSSIGGEPRSFYVNKVIKGWTEVLQMMPVGSKWKIYLPTELAYGVRPMPGSAIKPNMALIFEIELLEILDEEQKEEDQ